MSGKQIKKARKAAKTTAPKKSVVASAPRELELAKPATTLKLDLACGQNCVEGFEGVDLPGTGAHIEATLAALRKKADRTPEDDKRVVELEKARANLKHEVNLMRFPWPWPDSSVLEINCSHFVEHLPMEFVDEFGNYVPCGMPGAQDLFFKFFDEVYRVLVPEGWAKIVVPCLRNNRAFQDPTHRRFLPAEAFFYLFKQFRDVNKLDHYNVRCNYDGKIEPAVTPEINARSQDVQQRMFNESWNAIVDWHVHLKAVKDSTTAPVKDVRGTIASFQQIPVKSV